MQDEPIVLFPPTHEQETPSFHVERDLRDAFLNFLKQSGVNVAQHPLPVEESDTLEEIRLDAGTSLDRLEELRGEFFRGAQS